MLRETGLVQRKGNAIVDVSTSDWEDGQGVVIMPPDEINALLEEARGEERDIIKNEFREMQRQLAQVDAPFVALLDGRPQGTEVAFWRCGDHYYMKTHLPRTSNTERVCEEASLTEAAQSLLAAVQAAAPCACKSAKWHEEDCWYFVAPTHDHTESTPQKWIKPGDACPLCGEPLPAKPVSAMSIEEWAEELRGVRGWRGWCAKPPNSLRSVWAISAIQSGRIDPVYNGKGDTCLEAWCAAGVKFREEAANV